MNRRQQVLPSTSVFLNSHRFFYVHAGFSSYYISDFNTYPEIESISQTKEMLPWDLGRPGYLLATLITSSFFGFPGRENIYQVQTSNIEPNLVYGVFKIRFGLIDLRI